MRVSLQDFEFVGSNSMPEEPGVLIVFFPTGHNMRVLDVLESRNLRKTVTRITQRLGAECSSCLRYQLVVVPDTSSRAELAHKTRAHYSVL